MYPLIAVLLNCSITDSSPDCARAGVAVSRTLHATPAIAAARRTVPEVIHSSTLVVTCGRHPATLDRQSARSGLEISIDQRSAFQVRRKNSCYLPGMNRQRPFTDAITVTVPADIGVGAALACMRAMAMSPAKYGRYSPGDVPSSTSSPRRPPAAAAMTSA